MTTGFSSTDRSKINCSKKALFPQDTDAHCETWCGFIGCVETCPIDSADKDPSPWTPMANLRDLKTIGKLGEETNELGSAVARSIIQGIKGVNPENGKTNEQWVMEEIADVQANIDLVVERFGLDQDAIAKRKYKKMAQLRKWHEML